MVIFKKDFYFFKVRETWFRYNKEFQDIFKLRTYQFVQKSVFKKIPLLIKNESHTIEINLKKNTDVLFNSFSTNTRNYIRKGEKMNIQCDFKNDIKEFIEISESFSKKKEIYSIKRKTIEEIGENFITSFATYNNEIIVAHSYIIDKDLGITRLFQSVSKRLENNHNNQTISIANKLLTSHDIFYFKSKGFFTYDFGGYALNTDNKSLIGINSFKLLFGGEIKTCQSYFTIPYFLLLKVSQFLDRRY